MTALPPDDRPALMGDRSFLGLNLTQFLGAFNDNLFKQLVLLLCLDQVQKGGSDLQGLAMVLFAAPFILISGYAGFLSDRHSKRTIIVLCKIAEVLIVLLGMVGFLTGSLFVLLMVLCLMGVHSAFFGPSKYGILPEMLRTQDLPRANGMMLMATFLAIIFGLSAAGTAKHLFSSTLWVASLPCLVIAITGLVASLAIRPTPVAQPNLQFAISSVAIAPDTRRLLRENPNLLGVLLMSSVFWFVGGTIYPPAINAVCKGQFHFDDLITGFFAASTGVGIAIGCISAGILSKDRVRGAIVKLGAWGITFSLLILAVPGPGWDAAREEIRSAKQPVKIDVPPGENSMQGSDSDRVQSESNKSIHSRSNVFERADQNHGLNRDLFYRGTMLGPYGSALALISVGIFAGFFCVPLQVYLQSTAPSEQKGRIIGANNLMNWIGIAGAGGVYSIGRMIFVDWLMLPPATLFGFAGLLMLPVALFYKPPDAQVPQ